MRNIEFNKIPGVMKATKEGVERALLAVIIDMHGQAVENTPVKTGNLKGSLSWTIGGQVGGAENEHGVKRTQGKDTAYLGTNVHYGPHVEWGTYKMAAKPFLRPAFDGRKDTSKRIFRDYIKRDIEGAIR